MIIEIICFLSALFLGFYRGWELAKKIYHGLPFFPKEIPWGCYKVIFKSPTFLLLEPLEKNSHTYSPTGDIRCAEIQQVANLKTEKVSADLLPSICHKKGLLSVDDEGIILYLLEKKEGGRS